VACFLFHLFNCDAKECPLYFLICEHNLGQPVGLTSLQQINVVLKTFSMFAEFVKSSAEVIQWFSLCCSEVLLLAGCCNEPINLHW
jgi:hypothetical protein